MRKKVALVLVAMMLIGLCACKSDFSSKIGQVKEALEETCQAKKADSDHYKLMVDSQYSIRDVASDFEEGLYAEVKSRDFTFFGFHTVVKDEDVKSVFKYIKADPKSRQSDSVAYMEVLVIQFKNAEAAKQYYETIMGKWERTYQDNKALGELKENEFISKKDYFAFASESEFMTFNHYASIEKNTVLYVCVEGPNAGNMKKDYFAFTKKLDLSVITL
ncbi:MAG: hypothetical protein J6T40_00435 [Clostridiales bacterium]|nr:hypothetical protein [Clostridiales bacterium]